MLSTKLATSKLIVCEYCESTSFLEDAAVRSAGEKGVMHDRPCLLKLGRPFRYQGRDYTPIGQARFDYGQGWWDEFWAIGGDDGVWISVDEGDIAIEWPIEIAQNEIPAAFELKVGQTIQLSDEEYLVTEFNQATCLAVRGELPELLNPGDSFHYAHLRTGVTTLITLEYSGGEIGVTQGEWLDPFEIKT